MQVELKTAQEELAKQKEVLQRQMDLFERQKIQLQHSQHIFRSQPAMHLGSGSGFGSTGTQKQATQPQSILPMKLAQGSSKAKSNEQSPKSPPLVTSPGHNTIPPPRMQQLSSPPGGSGVGTSAGHTQLQQHQCAENTDVSHSHSQEKPKQKPDEEIIYF